MSSLLKKMLLMAVAVQLAACSPQGTSGPQAPTTTDSGNYTTSTGPGGPATPAGPARTESPGTASTAGPGSPENPSYPAGAGNASPGMMASMTYDAMFLEMMIDHHKGAIEMSRELAPVSQRPEVKALAEKIATDQEKEIARMLELRKSWYPDLPMMTEEQMEDHMKAMGGMESHDTDLAEADDPDERFLAMMIPHHQDAVQMSEQALQQAERGEIKEMAREMIDEQGKEIAQMRALQEASTAER